MEINYCAEVFYDFDTVKITDFIKFGSIEADEFLTAECPGCNQWLTVGYYGGDSAISNSNNGSDEIFYHEECCPRPCFYIMDLSTIVETKRELTDSTSLKIYFNMKPYKILKYKPECMSNVGFKEDIYVKNITDMCDDVFNLVMDKYDIYDELTHQWFNLTNCKTYDELKDNEIVKTFREKYICYPNEADWKLAFPVNTYNLFDIPQLEKARYLDMCFEYFLVEGDKEVFITGD